MQKSGLASSTNKQVHSKATESVRGRTVLHQRFGWLTGQLLVIALVWGMVAALLATSVLARPWATEIDVGGRWDGPYLDGFYGFERNDEGRFRWSKPEGELYLPGVGTQTTLELRVHGGTDGKTLAMSDGSAIVLRPGWQRVRLLPPADSWSGDVRFTLSTDPQLDSDRRALGFVLDTMRLRGQPNNPPIGQAVLIGLSVACGSALAGWGMRRLRAGVLAGLLLTAGAIYVLGNQNGDWRLYLTDYTGRLALVLGCSIVVAFLSERLLHRLAQGGAIRITPSGRRALCAVVVLAFLIRFGALAYPLNFPSDLRFNLSRAWMVRNGEFLQLFLPNADLTPVQWKSDITVPRTPYYYLLVSPLTALPGVGPELALMGLSSAVDALAVGLVGLLVLLAGGGRRAALVAATLVATHFFALVAVMSWGIYTTLLGQCLSLLTAFLWLYWRDRLGEWRVQLGIVAAMTGAFLSHPATLLLLGATWALLVVGLLLLRDRLWRPTLRIGLLASLCALVLYYGWHVPELVRRSLPTVFDALSGGRPLNTDAKAAASKQGLAVIWPQLIEMFSYRLLGGAAIGAALLGSLRFGAWRNGRLFALLLVCWGVIYPFFALADVRVALNYKHTLFMLPLVAMLVGIFYGQLLRYRWGRVVVGALLALVFWQGMDLVVYKVMYAYISLR